jgi:hypothetical protein
LQTTFFTNRSPNMPQNFFKSNPIWVDKLNVSSILDKIVYFVNFNFQE